jgi:hypothetical protein
MNGSFCGAVTAWEDVMAGILAFMSRNLRIAIAVAVVAAAVGGAGAIGWITAPI